MEKNLLKISYSLCILSWELFSSRLFWLLFGLLRLPEFVGGGVVTEVQGRGIYWITSYLSTRINPSLHQLFLNFWILRYFPKSFQQDSGIRYPKTQIVRIVVSYFTGIQRSRIFCIPPSITTNIRDLLKNSDSMTHLFYI